MMYEAFYELREKPFSLLPDPDLIYWGRVHTMAFAMLEFGLLNSAGFTVVTGEIGAGKTTLVRRLLRSIGPNMTVGLISNSPQGREELLQWILMSLDQPFEGSYATLLSNFNAYIRGQYAANRRTVLIIDEAQNLEPEALEHLRMLSNINADKAQFLQLILLGQPQLRDLLVSPRLHQFAQRISSDFHLTALTPDEVANYIEFRLAGVGAKKEVFSKEACDQIAAASGGIPRIVNVICDTALVYGFSGGRKLITKELVSQVIADKQQYSIFPLLPVSQSA
jgi:general secretion pathway protein A